MLKFLLKPCKACGRKFFFERGCRFCKRISKVAEQSAVIAVPSSKETKSEKRMSYLDFLKLIVHD